MAVTQLIGGPKPEIVESPSEDCQRVLEICRTVFDDAARTR